MSVTWGLGVRFRRRGNWASSFGLTSKSQSPSFHKLYNWPLQIHLLVSSALFLNCFRIQAGKTEVISMESIKMPTCSRTAILVSKLPIFACRVWEQEGVVGKMGVWCQSWLVMSDVLLYHRTSPYSCSSTSFMFYTMAWITASSLHCCGTKKIIINTEALAGNLVQMYTQNYHPSLIYIVNLINDCNKVRNNIYQ